MTFLLQAAAMILPGMLRLGPLRVPVYGLFAAVGVVAALWLSQRTAKMAGLPPEKLWDAGMVAVAAAFVASRLLLVILDFRAFMRFPLMVLALPSLTCGGMVLTAFVVFLWLRWKHLPVLSVLDAWAPCAAFLAAILSLGHYVEGTNAGMPTNLPWGIVTKGDTVLGRVHPVQIYTLIAALGMTEFLLLRLRSRFRAHKPAGNVAGLALVVGGVISFLLDMVTQPVESQGSAWLDPSQWVALVAVVLGVLVLQYRPRPQAELTSEQVAKILDDFVSGTGGAWDWDVFLTAEQFRDPTLANIQGHCAVLPEQYPVEASRGGWCNDQGLEVIRSYVRQLRGGYASQAEEKS